MAEKRRTVGGSVDLVRSGSVSEWAQRVRDVRKAEDEKEEEQRRGLEEEIQRSRVAREHRRNTSSVSYPARSFTPPSAASSPPPTDRADALAKLTGEAPVPAPSLAGLVGGRASGPRLNRPESSSTSNENAAPARSPDPGLGRPSRSPFEGNASGGIALPGLSIKSNGSSGGGGGGGGGFAFPTRPPSPIKLVRPPSPIKPSLPSPVLGAPRPASPTKPFYAARRAADFPSASERGIPLSRSSSHNSLVSPPGSPKPTTLTSPLFSPISIPTPITSPLAPLASSPPKPPSPQKPTSLPQSSSASSLLLRQPLAPAPPSPAPLVPASCPSRAFVQSTSAARKAPTASLTRLRGSSIVEQRLREAEAAAAASAKREAENKSSVSGAGSSALGSGGAAAVAEGQKKRSSVLDRWAPVQQAGGHAPAPIAPKPVAVGGWRRPTPPSGETSSQAPRRLPGLGAAQRPGSFSSSTNSPSTSSSAATDAPRRLLDLAVGNGAFPRPAPSPSATTPSAGAPRRLPGLGAEAQPVNLAPSPVSTPAPAAEQAQALNDNAKMSAAAPLSHPNMSRPKKAKRAGGATRVAAAHKPQPEETTPQPPSKAPEPSIVSPSPTPTPASEPHQARALPTPPEHSSISPSPPPAPEPQPQPQRSRPLPTPPAPAPVPTAAEQIAPARPAWRKPAGSLASALAFPAPVPAPAPASAVPTQTQTPLGAQLPRLSTLTAAWSTSARPDEKEVEKARVEEKEDKVEDKVDEKVEVKQIEKADEKEDEFDPSHNMSRLVSSPASATVDRSRNISRLIGTAEDTFPPALKPSERIIVAQRPSARQLAREMEELGHEGTANGAAEVIVNEAVREALEAAPGVEEKVEPQEKQEKGDEEKVEKEKVEEVLPEPMPRPRSALSRGRSMSKKRVSWHESLIQEDVDVLTDEPPLPPVDLTPFLGPSPSAHPSSNEITISTDIFILTSDASTKLPDPPRGEPPVFYDAELLAVVWRYKKRESGLVETHVWGWRGAESKADAGAERRLAELGRRFGTSPVEGGRGWERDEMVAVLGGTLVTRQGARAYFDPASTQLYAVSSPTAGVTYVSQVDFTPASLCSAHSFVVSLMQDLSVWHGRGSRPPERAAAGTYARALAPEGAGVDVMREGRESELFRAIMDLDGEGMDGYADSWMWRWRAEMGEEDAALSVWEVKVGELPRRIASPSLRALEDAKRVIVLHAPLELLVVVPPTARGERDDIRLALGISIQLADALARIRPFKPPVHTLILPSALPRDFVGYFRVADPKAELGTGAKRMNILNVATASEHLRRTSWAPQEVADEDFLPLGVAPVASGGEATTAA